VSTLWYYLERLWAVQGGGYLLNNVPVWGWVWVPVSHADANGGWPVPEGWTTDQIVAEADRRRDEATVDKCREVRYTETNDDETGE
jgi:hypothetical protein